MYYSVLTRLSFSQRGLQTLLYFN